MPLCLKEKLRHCTAAEICSDIFWNFLESKPEIISRIQVVEWRDWYRGKRALELRSRTYIEEYLTQLDPTYQKLGNIAAQPILFPELEELTIITDHPCSIRESILSCPKLRKFTVTECFGKVKEISRISRDRLTLDRNFWHSLVTYRDFLCRLWHRWI
jgi:hypothetical protein